uniref:Signal recognition particle 19 kDa protein n=1 Tax=Sinocyclocheilus anshuiensis TaxID=1608454 RepID=A0A671KD33_9TELE
RTHILFIYCFPARFMCICPAYINSKKTIAGGRRIAAEKAVENPSCAEIRDVLTAAGLNVLLENKMYPREWNRDGQFRGRVRIQLKLDDGSLCQDKFASSKLCILYLYTYRMIPKLKSRTQKSGGAEVGSQQGEGGKKGKKKKNSVLDFPRDCRQNSSDVWSGGPVW